MSYQIICIELIFFTETPQTNTNCHSLESQGGPLRWPSFEKAPGQALCLCRTVLIEWKKRNYSYLKNLFLIEETIMSGNNFENFLQASFHRVHPVRHLPELELVDLPLLRNLFQLTEDGLHSALDRVPPVLVDVVTFLQSWILFVAL